MIFVKRTSFQFQYGSIKSKKQRSFNNIISTFQFQYGSIKRLMSCRRSTLISDFNSNMVRLKGKIKNRTKCLRPAFQFQYGSIKSDYVSAVVLQK